MEGWEVLERLNRLAAILKSLAFVRWLWTWLSPVWQRKKPPRQLLIASDEWRLELLEEALGNNPRIIGVLPDRRKNRVDPRAQKTERRFYPVDGDLYRFGWALAPARDA